MITPQEAAQLSDEELAERNRRLFGHTDPAKLRESQVISDEIIRRRRASEAEATPTEAQELIAYILREHQRCSLRCTPEVLAAEIDEALGGLRKITGTGLLTESGFLTTGFSPYVHDHRVKPKTYTKWLTGWTEAE